MIQGKNVILSIDGKAIAAAQSCDLDVDRDMIEVCSPVEGQWKRYIPTKIRWSASVSMLVVDMDNPQAWLNEMKSSAQPLTMRFYDTELGIYQVGEVWIKSWKVGASVGSLATFNLSLQGNGALRDAGADDYPILAGDTLYTKWHFNENTGNFTQTGTELDEDGNIVKHE